MPPGKGEWTLMDSGSWPRRLSPLPIILLASFLLRLHNLGHTGLS